MIKKYFPTITVLAILIALYTTAFIYSFLNAVLLTGLIFFFILSIILFSRLAQMKEINDNLVREIGTLSEKVGKLYVSEQMLYSIIKGEQKQEEDTKEEAEL